MEPINVMVNGLPGNMAAMTAELVVKASDLNLVPYALTGPDVKQSKMVIGSETVELITPDKRAAMISAINKAAGPLICVDYTHPSAANDNAEFYCEHNLPFVMGTTGGNRENMVDAVKRSRTAAVIAPNMGKQIVAFQAMMDYAAQSFPNVFEGYTLEIKESHQKGKADTSGTAKAMVEYFNKLGIPFSKDQIIMERDPNKQRTEMGIPEAHLGGHGWHTYTLRSQDGSVLFQFTHNVNGREVYARGTLDAIRFLANKLDKGAEGQTFTMIDVLKGI